MITVNLNEEKELRFKISNVESIIHIQFVIQLMSGVKEIFLGELIRNEDMFKIKLPILKDIIKNDKDGLSYIEATYLDNTKIDLEKSKVVFVDNEVLNKLMINTVKTNDEDLRPIKQVSLNMDNVVLKPKPR